jgi:hypothetical protein
MKFNFLCCFYFIFNFGFCQTSNDDAVYLDSLHNIGTEDNFKYIRITKDYYTNKDTYLVSDFYKSGKLEMRGTTKDKNILKLDGTCIYYYENGNKKQISNYADSNLNGKQFEWYENGNIKSEKEISWDSKNFVPNVEFIHYWDENAIQKVIDGNGTYTEIKPEESSQGEIKNRLKQGKWTGTNIIDKYTYTENYENGILIDGVSIDSSKTEHTYKTIEYNGIPRKGMEAFYSYIGKNLRIPKEVSTNNITGKIYASFFVEKDGSIKDVTIIRDIGYDTGKEVIRIIKNYKDWNPSTCRGIGIKKKYSLPITISSPKQYNLYPNY